MLLRPHERIVQLELNRQRDLVIDTCIETAYAAACAIVVNEPNHKESVIVTTTKIANALLMLKVKKEPEQ